MEDKPQFRVDYEATTEEVGVVILEGEIDIYSAPEFKEVLVNGIEGGAKRVIVDLSAVTFIDSTALGVLVSGAKRVRPRNGNLDIVCTDENIIPIIRDHGSRPRLRDLPQSRRGTEGGVRLRGTPEGEQVAARPRATGRSPGASTWSSAAQERYGATDFMTWPTPC